MYSFKLLIQNTQRFILTALGIAQGSWSLVWSAPFCLFTRFVRFICWKCSCH